jgi:catechol 2,3-dioxygenase-like lactoylglutathione lyase family enzyme
MTMPTNICQVALTVADEQASVRFYSALFGMRHVFGTKSFRGRVVEKIQGIPGAASRCEWLIDDREFFQLELFRFESPASRPLPKEYPERHLGYRRLIFQLHSLAEFERQAAALGYGPVTARRGADGLTRASMRDPDGILIELVEIPAGAETSHNCRLSGVGLVVADLGRAIDSFRKGLGFELQAAREDE